MLLVVVSIILAVTFQSVYGLQCYECINIELQSSYNPFSGKTNPACGSDPSSTNLVTCPSDTNACGSVDGQIKAKFPDPLGTFTAQIQVRGCVQDDSLGGCRKVDGTVTGLISEILSILSGISDVSLDGQMCTCKWDRCVLCDEGVFVAGYCVKYWMLGLTIGVAVGMLLLLVTCCCCCCCGTCCQKRRQGVIITNAVPYQPLLVSPAYGSSPGLSVQSGDIIRYPSTNPGPVSYPRSDYIVAVDSTA